ncbi:unnamed protein product [Diplocarpon coronariae]
MASCRGTGNQGGLVWDGRASPAHDRRISCVRCFLLGGAAVRGRVINLEVNPAAGRLPRGYCSDTVPAPFAAADRKCALHLAWTRASSVAAACHLCLVRAWAAPGLHSSDTASHKAVSVMRPATVDIASCFSYPPSPDHDTTAESLPPGDPLSMPASPPTPSRPYNSLPPVKTLYPSSEPPQESSLLHREQTSIPAQHSPAQPPKQPRKRRGLRILRSTSESTITWLSSVQADRRLPDTTTPCS